MRREFTHNSAFLGYERQLRKLHRLIAEGQGDGDAADALRDEMDEDYRALSSEEIARLDGISADLYSLNEPRQDVEQSLPGDRPRALALLQARERGNWELVLSLLRELGHRFPAPMLAFQRFKAYSQLGHGETALLFLQHAVNLQPDSFRFRFVLLQFLVEIGREADAVEIAERYLAEPDTHPTLVIGGAHVRFNSLRSRPSEIAYPIYREIAIALERALGKSQILRHEPHSTAILGYTTLGFCHDKLGDMRSAVRAFSQALKLDPKSHVLRVARGLAQARQRPESAAADFRRAAERGSPLFIPYFFLAPYALGRGRWKQARRYAERILSISEDPAIQAEAHQWLAIASFEEGEAWPSVEERFQTARSLDPLNVRITENHALCCAAHDNATAVRTAITWIRPGPEDFPDSSAAFPYGYSHEFLELALAA